MTTHYALWALPVPRIGAVLTDEIDRLTKAAGYPIFAPHLTLASMDQKPDIAALSSLANYTYPFSLIATGFERGNTLSQALYLSLAPDRCFKRAQRGCREHLQQDSKLSDTPHISLYYGVDPPDPVQVLLPEIEEVEFDRIGLIRIESPITDPREVTDWRVEAKLNLGSG